jgi:hypothetical protein
MKLNSNEELSMNNKYLFTYIIILSIAVFLIISCGERISLTIHGDLKGFIALEDDEISDYSGIVVELYKPVKLDTTIARLNQEYPHIGVHISQETEFDHRLHDPIRYATTNANGSFEFLEIPVGSLYNLVAYKEDWGILYEYEISITEGENFVSSMSDPLIINQEITVDSHIYDELVLESGKHYIFELDTIFHPGSHIVIKPGAVIRINPLAAVSIYGSLTVDTEPGKYFKVTSNDSFYNRSNDIVHYSHFTVMNSATVTDNEISNGIFTFGMNSLVIRENAIEVRNSTFSGKNTGLTFEQVMNISVINSIFRYTTAETQQALYLSYVENGHVDKSVFINNSTGLTLMFSINVEISNSYFSQNYVLGILNWYDSDNLVRNCIFVNGPVGIINTARSYINVNYSILGTDIGIYNKVMQLQWAYPIQNYNNFDCSVYAVKTDVYFNPHGGVRYLNATYNYWGTTNREEIEQLIWDRNDEVEGHPYYHWLLGVYDFEPFLNRPYAGAGIQLD